MEDTYPGVLSVCWSQDTSWDSLLLKMHKKAKLGQASIQSLWDCGIAITCWVGSPDCPIDLGFSFRTGGS